VPLEVPLYPKPAALKPEILRPLPFSDVDLPLTGESATIDTSGLSMTKRSRYCPGPTRMLRDAADGGAPLRAEVMVENVVARLESDGGEAVT
jgi:hypothetical protein